jgi:hypothetical protein
VSTQGFRGKFSLAEINTLQTGVFRKKDSVSAFQQQKPSLTALLAPFLFARQQKSLL